MNSNLPEVHDRVTEAYMGVFGGNAFMRQTQARIHWICRRVEGKKVADIGASQGIASILLAREGKTVLAVDSDAKAIGQARDYLAAEPERVQERVTLVEADALAHPFETGAYDTVVMGEILEHLTQPENMVKIAASCLRKNGRIVVTVPFGINDFFDHKQTYYLSGAVSLIHKYFEIDEIDPVANWLALTGLRREAPVDTPPVFDAAIVARIEQRFEAIERRYGSRIESLGQTVSATEKRAKALAEQLAEAKTKAAGADRAAQEQTRAAQQAGERVAALEEELQKLRAELERAKEEIVTLKVKLAQSDLGTQHAEARAAALATERDGLLAELNGVKEEAVRFQVRLGEMDGGTRIQTLKAQQTEERAVAFEAERETLRAELGRAHEEAVGLKVQLGQLDQAIRHAVALLTTFEDRLPSRSGKPLRVPEASAPADALLLRIQHAMMEAQVVRQDPPKVQAPPANTAKPPVKPAAAVSSAPNADVLKRRVLALEAANRKLTIEKDKVRASHSYRLGNAFVVFAKRPRPIAIPKLVRSLRDAMRPKPVLPPPQPQPATPASAPGAIATSAATGAPPKTVSPPPAAVSPPAPPAKASTPAVKLAPAPLEVPTPPLLKTGPQITPVRRKALYVLDEISEASWSSSLELIKLQRNATREQIDSTNADFVFLESCWKGNGGSWEFAFTSPNLSHANARALLEAIAHVKAKGLPLVFWNKEDPMHFDRFLPIAEKADIILTTDSNKLADYRRAVPEAKLDVVPFAALPSICNPTDRSRTVPGSVCFAGAYYPEHHDERVRQMNFVLPAIEEFKGAIYDRYSHLPTDRYRFPDRYKPFIKPSVPFSEVTKVYKQFKVFLNVNTIVDSPTMMSRRVYELLASGTPVVSAPSDALREQFPGIVATGETEAEIKRLVGELLADEEHWHRIAHLGMREVMTKHTYARRTDHLLGILGKSDPTPAPLVSIIVASCRPKNVARTIENVTRQAHPRCEVIYAVTPSFTEEDRAALASVTRRSPNIERAEIIVLGEEVSLGRCLNEAIRASRGEYIAKFDDDNFYLEHFISDLLLPFQYGDYDIVGKDSYFCYLGGLNKLIWRHPEKWQRTTKFVAGDAMIMRRRVFERTAFPEKRVGEDTKLLKDVVAYGGKIYSADHFNFVKYRSADLNDHTWRETEEKLLNQSVEVATGLDLNLVRL